MTICVVARPLFATLDIATGHVIGRCNQRQRAVEFRKFLSWQRNRFEKLE
jgi:hypothetical protein